MTLLTSLLCCFSTSILSQELQATVHINHSKIQGVEATRFDHLQTALTQFLNDQKWTPLHFLTVERIPCSFSITVNDYDHVNGFKCSAIVQANRPVYRTTYSTIIYKNVDEHFDFDYADLSQLTFSEDHVVQQLSALCAYYAYLIIGINLDSFAPLGGTDVLQRCLNTAHAAQALPYKGWESFANDKSRFASSMITWMSGYARFASCNMPIIARD